MTRASLGEAILAQVGSLRPDTTCCPSQIARAVAADWRPLMQPVRDEGAHLTDQGLIRILQKGREVSSAELRGPIRLAPALPVHDRN